MSSTERVCGEFEEPTNPDQGQCHPYRVKLDCEAPVVPAAPCDDTEYTIVYDPDATPPFSIISRLFDEECEPVLDQLGDPVMTTTQ